MCTAERATVSSGLLGPDQVWTTDLPGRDSFLNHHRLHTKPLLPAAFAMALAAEAVGRRAPISFENVTFHAPMYASTIPAAYRFLPHPAGMRIVFGDPANGLTCAEFDIRDCPAQLPGPASEPADLISTVYGPYVGTAALDMSGPFVGLRQLRARAGRARARYQPRLPDTPTMYPDFPICARLVDAMIQLALVSLGARRGGMHQLLPSGWDAVRVDCPETDRQLLARHPEGIELHAETRGARDADVIATTPTGHPIAHLIGLRAVDLTRRPRDTR
ncbi:polyketide synthase dehydratase domain-containing protein [Nocardia sp. NBC_00508]|uniref:polyketide synthase dehydratase domain-containing protein n=1 Tax=Nocardia sp. NBC_00508 TaxID=2975992 RepID=UPI002E8063B7|nr:polyketide synthase dehydratase domain-containing protein [Nocardia sp. NBC_00508]WUD65851.1 polyketide synthase dehydratase domain-containing protein [Nocardia sp. NBC_00508]